TGDLIGGVRFQNLATVSITSGTAKIVLSDAANGYVIADAIRLVPTTGGMSFPGGSGSPRTRGRDAAIPDLPPRADRRQAPSCGGADTSPAPISLQGLQSGTQTGGTGISAAVDTGAGTNAATSDDMLAQLLLSLGEDPNNPGRRPHR